MLLVHPFSYCDICLDTHIFQNPAQSPHALPCGHISCKTCLHAVNPGNCPVCQTPFLPDHAPKLNVSLLENSQEERALDYLHQLSLAWDEKPPAGALTLALVIEDIESWLQSQPIDSTGPPPKARDALARFHAIRCEWEKDHQTIPRLEATLQYTKEQASQKQHALRAVEASLRAHIDDLTTKLNVMKSNVTAPHSPSSESWRGHTQPIQPPEPIPVGRHSTSSPEIPTTSESTLAANSNREPAITNSDRARISENSSHPTRPVHWATNLSVEAHVQKHAQSIYQTQLHSTDKVQSNIPQPDITRGATPNRTHPPNPIARGRFYEHLDMSSSSMTDLSIEFMRGFGEMGSSGDPVSSSGIRHHSTQMDGNMPHSIAAGASLSRSPALRYPLPYARTLPEPEVGVSPPPSSETSQEQRSHASKENRLNRMRVDAVQGDRSASSPVIAIRPPSHGPANGVGGGPSIVSPTPSASQMTTKKVDSPVCPCSICKRSMASIGSQHPAQGCQSRQTTRGMW